MTGSQEEPDTPAKHEMSETPEEGGARETGTAPGSGTASAPTEPGTPTGRGAADRPGAAARSGAVTTPARATGPGRRTWVWVAAAGAAVVVLGGAGIAIAAKGDGHARPVAWARGGPPLIPPPGLPGGPDGPAGRGDDVPAPPWHLREHGPKARGMIGALHGEYVVPKPEGGYQTLASQNGEVTEVSDSSITLKSADGYQRTYTVTGETFVNATHDGIEKGAQASVAATVADGKATATRIVDLDQLDRMRGRWRHNPDSPVPD